METYQSATATLKTILKNPLLDIDKIHQTTDELDDVMASQKEVDDAVRSVGMGRAGEIDEDKLEDELKGLVADEEAKAVQERIEKEKVLELRKKEEEETVRLDEIERENAKRSELEKKEPAKRIDIDTKTPGGENEESSQDSEAEQHEERYRDATQRDIEEKQPAEMERSRKEEKRIIAD